LERIALFTHLPFYPPPPSRKEPLVGFYFKTTGQNINYLYNSRKPIVQKRILKIIFTEFCGAMGMVVCKKPMVIFTYVKIFV
jgi:hypothetical protein